MADHGTRHIRHVDPSTPAAYHIPLILSGGALNVQDTVVTTIGSQTDMVAGPIGYGSFRIQVQP